MCGKARPYRVPLINVNPTIDLLQVDLLVSGASLVWPRSGEAPRHMKSDEGLFWKSNPTIKKVKVEEG